MQLGHSIYVIYIEEFVIVSMELKDIMNTNHRGQRVIREVKKGKTDVKQGKTQVKQGKT